MRVLNDALAHFEGQVQPREVRIPQLQIFHGAQRLQIVIEEFAMAAHQKIERALARVSKRRMPDVVYQRQGLDEINIQVKRRRDGPRNLRHLHSVSQPRTKMVGVAAREDLRLVFQPAKGAGMDDAIAVPLERIAIRMGRLGIAASTRILDAHRVAGEHRRSLAAASAAPLSGVSQGEVLAGRGPTVVTTLANE